MTDRIRFRVVDGVLPELSPAERETTEAHAVLDGFEGCNTCGLADLANANDELGFNDAGLLKHVVIEISQFKQDAHLFNGQRIAEGIDLSQQQDTVEAWMLSTVAKHPQFDTILSDVDTVVACVNCPERFDYRVHTDIEYTPDSL